MSRKKSEQATGLNVRVDAAELRDAACLLASMSGRAPRESCSSTRIKHASKTQIEVPTPGRMQFEVVGHGLTLAVMAGDKLPRTEARVRLDSALVNRPGRCTVPARDFSRLAAGLRDVATLEVGSLAQGAGGSPVLCADDDTGSYEFSLATGPDDENLLPLPDLALWTADVSHISEPFRAEAEQKATVAASEDSAAQAERVLKMPGLRWVELVERAAYCALDDETHPILTGLLLQAREGWQLTAVATDTYRLARYRLMLNDSVPDFKALVPVVPLRKWVGVTRREAECVMRLGTRHVTFVAGRYAFRATLVEGEYPDYEKVIPRDPALGYRIDAPAWKAALAALAPAAEADSWRVVLTDVLGGLCLSAGGELGQVRAKVPCCPASVLPGKAGFGAPTVYNLRYLQQASRSAKRTVSLATDGPLNAAQILVDDLTADQHLTVLMPMQIMK